MSKFGGIGARFRRGVLEGERSRRRARWLVPTVAISLGLLDFGLAELPSQAAAGTTATGAATATSPADALGASTPQWSANLLTGPSATLSGTGIWASTLSTLTAVAAPSQAGAGALALTNNTGLTTDPAIFTGTGTGSWPAASPGNTYRSTIWVSAATVSRQTSPFIKFFDASGNTTGFIMGQPASDPVGSWLEEAPVVAIAPPGTSFVQTGVIVWNAAPGETHFADTATLQSVTGTTPAVTGPLSTSGNQILDGNGAPVTLRGINRAGMEYNVPSVAITQTEIDQAHQWGANFIRLGVSEQHFLTTGCAYSSAYVAQLDQVVNWITSDGMVALIDPVEFANPCGTGSVQRPMADAMTVTFWQQVAARYAQNPLVAFDLFNEPHNMADTTWLNGGTVVDTTGIYQVVGMQQLYNAVRSTGATNLVFAEGNNWASTFPSNVHLSGYNIVYGVHYYPCPEATAPQCTGNPYSAAPVLQNWVGPARTVPVVFDEFGYPSSTDGGYAANAIAFAEANGLGWAVMGWNGDTMGKFDTLAENGNTGFPTATYEPSASGMPLLAGLSLNR